jgi:hypothetical protein
MNMKTARHLNALLEAAEPTKIEGGNLVGPGASSLMEKFKTVAADLEATVMVERIKKAAAKREGVSTVFGSIWTHSGQTIVLGLSKDLLAACTPHWQLLLNDYNAQTAAAYEAYRVACEQGVAVPPVEVAK